MIASDILGTGLQLRSGLILKNRIAKSAMSECLGLDSGEPSNELHTLYSRLAKGGSGLLVTGNVMVSRNGIGEPNNVVIDGTQPSRELRQWAQVARTHQAKCLVQINHAGRQSPRILNRNPVAPSSIPLKKWGLFATPRALETEEVDALVVSFARTARVLQEAGFDGVQIHAAHGYLINQFLSPNTNVRTDHYGGSLDNRMRFLLEIHRAIRATCGPTFTISVKLNSADFLRGGFSHDDAIVVARTLSEEGIDLLEVSGGTYERPEMAIPTRASSAAREAHFLEYARAMRACTKCPLMLTGGMRTPDFMASVVADGSLDVVGLGRPVALEPDFPAEILAGRTEGSRCIAPRGRVQILSAAIDLAWHQKQLHRMGRGEDPSTKMSRWGALFSSAGAMFRRRARSTALVLARAAT